MNSLKKLGLAVIVILFWVSCQNTSSSLSKISFETKAIDTILKQDSTIIKEFLPYKKKMTEEINSKLTYSPKNISKSDGVYQSSLGNLMADLMFEKSYELFKNKTGKELDFALSNSGGIRAEIEKGDVQVVHAFNIMPFENTLVVAELTKEKTEELFEYFIVKKRAHPLSKQVKITIGKGDNIEILINGKLIEDGRTYYVATSNYLQKGGDNMNFFLNPESLYDTNYLIRDAITEYFASQDTLRAELDNRIIIK